ncbi:MAG: tetratricopeptide repeat protein [Chitinophagaceae bacterium]|nr:tetratricopeptide repeat protein [Chitinophagaceae bacterium]
MQNLEAGQETLKRFNSRLAVLFDEVGQQKITLYLKGDAAELEKRRYYNAAYDTYDIYPRMFEVALKLTEPDNYYYNIIRVKLHYFAGVALRLKIPLTRDQKPLIEKALAELEKALALEEYAPYIYNELGILYSYKKNDAKAEKYFVTASQRAPSWAIPLINLADLYAEQGKLLKAGLYIDSAFKLQPGLQDIYVSRGIIFEKNEKRLQAEEAFQKSIKLNDRHFLPFERLGYVYMNNMAFAKADSVFNAAAERKKGFYFSELNNPRHMKFPKTVPEDEVKCSIDFSSISNTDLAGQFALGYGAYRDEDLASAETAFKNVIALDQKNPLAFHYLGKTLAEQKRYAEAEIIFKLALDNHLPYEPFLKYFDSLIKARSYGIEIICIDSCFRFGYYDKTEDLLLLAQLYENWQHYAESEIYYRRLIAADPNRSTGYLGLVNLFEKTGRFTDAENYLLEYNIRSNYSIDRELHAFYQRVTGLFPENADWNIKAGNFQYAIARSVPGSIISDIKMTDPFTGEMVYKFPQPREPNLYPRIRSRVPLYGTQIPDTRPKMKYRPYTDGIYYFQKAALHLPYHETQLAGVYGKTGDLYNWQGLPDSALYFYEKAIELNPADAGTRNKLVETYADNHLF